MKQRICDIREWPCLVCGVLMRSAMADPDDVPGSEEDCGYVFIHDRTGPAIDNGMNFYSSGNYGSTLADMGPSLQFLIHDGCLRALGDRVFLVDHHFHGPGPHEELKADSMGCSLAEHEGKRSPGGAQGEKRAATRGEGEE